VERRVEGGRREPDDVWPAGVAHHAPIGTQPRAQVIDVNVDAKR